MNSLLSQPTMEQSFIEDWHLITMVICDCTVGKRKRRLGLFRGKSFRDLARFMLFVGSTVCAIMMLIPAENVLAFQGTRWKIVPIGLMGVNPKLISLTLAKKRSTLTLCCYPMFNFTDMMMGFSPITPLINAGIYACNHVVAKDSNTPISGIMVMHIVSLRHYCSMDIARQITKEASIWKCQKAKTRPPPDLLKNSI